MPSPALEPAAAVGNRTPWEPFVCERWRAERVRAVSGLAQAPYVPAPGEAELVPPSFLSAQYVDAFALGVPDAPARLNGGNRCRWLEDVRVGDALERSSAVTCVQTKHGRTGRLELYSIETTYRRAGSPVEVARLGYTAIRRYPNVAEAAPAPPAATPGRPSGDGVPEGAAKVFTTSVSSRDTVRYAVATEDLYEGHYDEPYARASGLPGTIVHGLLKMAWLARGALEYGGAGSVVRELSASYRGMDLVGADFTVWVTPEEPATSEGGTAPGDTGPGGTDPGGTDLGGTRLRLYGQSRDGSVSTTGTAVIDTAVIATGTNEQHGEEQRNTWQ